MLSRWRFVMAKKAVRKTSTTKKGKAKTAAPKKKEKAKRVVKTPSVKVKEQFGSKENLLKEVKKLFEKTDFFPDRLNPEKGLERVSNRKLLRLHAMATELKDKFGSRKSMIEEYVKLAGQANVEAMKEKLAEMTLGRLVDLYRRVEKLGRRQTRKAKA
jgi:hypothetical protein